MAAACSEAVLGGGGLLCLGPSASPAPRVLPQASCPSPAQSILPLVSAPPPRPPLIPLLSQAPHAPARPHWGLSCIQGFPTLARPAAATRPTHPCRLHCPDGGRGTQLSDPKPHPESPNAPALVALCHLSAALTMVFLSPQDRICCDIFWGSRITGILSVLGRC